MLARKECQRCRPILAGHDCVSALVATLETADKLVHVLLHGDKAAYKGKGSRPCLSGPSGQELEEAGN